MKNTLLIILLFLHTISFSQNITNMGGHNYKGIPNNLDTKEESIRLDLLKDISLLLPDGKNLQNFNPSLYNRSILSFITLQENSDVYLAFISEGADFKSSVGFYTFKGNPPSHPTQIYSPKVVFPNVTQGEGVLKQGNRVKLGNFEAGTSI
ncbi:MAG: hypothetical protein OEW75_18590, partial [Cyclobacteriaceae bacterium]|nr:hypothetical protein [Cyclobacteriaceae bacterium]